MAIAKALKRACVTTDDSLGSKDEVLGYIAGLAAQYDELSMYTREDIFASLLAREATGSTGFEDGIAIPHCALDSARDFVAGIVVVPHGIDFRAINGEPSRIFAFIIGPLAERDRHIQLLSALSRALTDQSFYSAAVGAANSDEIWQSLEAHFASHETNTDEKDLHAKTIFNVFIQREEYLDEIIKIFSSAVQGSLMVIDANNAGYYLNKMPLFSTYWTEPAERYNKMVVAIVDRAITNDTIRRINTLVETIEDSPGVLVTAQEVLYSNGSINF